MKHDSPKPPITPSSEDDLVDIGELLSNLWLERWLIVGIVGFVVLISVAYAFLATPVYRADVLLQVDSSQGPLSGLQNITEMLGATPPADSEIQIIRSRSVLMASVKDQHLDIEVTPDYLPLVGRLWADPSALVAVTRLEVPDEWVDEGLTLQMLGKHGFAIYGPDGALVLKGKSGHVANASVATGSGTGQLSIFVAGLQGVPGTEFTVTKLQPLEVYQALNDNLLVVEQGKDTGILEMSLEGAQPQKITNVLNAIANNYLKQNVERQSQQAAQSLKFINSQLPDLKQQVDDAETALSEYRSHNGSVDMSLEAQSLMKQAADVDTQLSQIDLKQAELAQQFTEKHPSMVALKDKREELRSEKSRIEAQIRQLPISEQKAVQLTRNVTVANELYTALLNKAQELKVAKAGTVGNVRIVDPAMKPIKPVKPKKSLVILLGFVLGLFLGVFAVFLRQALSRNLSDPDEVEKDLGLPIYAVVPFSEHQLMAERKNKAVAGRRTLLAREYFDDPAVESMRSLRTSLQFAVPATEGRVIAVTGPTPEVGKSFIAANLACVLAQSGSRVLLLDADLRRGRQHRFFGSRREPGLSQVLSGELTFQQAVRDTDVTGMHLLTTGVIPPNPSELFMQPRMRELLGYAERTYGYVIMDTPPVLAVSEAAVLTALSSHAFVVMRSGTHTSREMHVCLKRLQRINVEVRGLILNGFRARDARRYGYGYSYQYEYE
jgi:tyrosine-protein kinase Etk/Wzc